MTGQGPTMPSAATPRDNGRGGGRAGERAGALDAPIAIGGMSRRGLVPAATAIGGLWLGHVLVGLLGRHYLEAGWRNPAVGMGAVACLVLSGWMTVRLARRGDYPWLMCVAAVAIPFYEPQNKPDTLAWRLASGLYGLALVLVAVYAFVRMVQRTDELERRINQEALAFAFAASLVLVMACSLLQDLLPPLRGLWVATGMIATWLVGWNAAVRRYR